jgi:hypothetical protein
MERTVNLLAVSTGEPAGKRRVNLKLWADSDDVFHGAIGLGTVSGTTSNDCARQTVGDPIHEMDGARHGVNISYIAIVSNRIVAGRPSGRGQGQSFAASISRPKPLGQVSNPGMESKLLVIVPQKLRPTIILGHYWWRD